MTASQATTEHSKATADPADSALNVRLPRVLHDRLRELATRHGCSISAEVRRALILFAYQSATTSLGQPGASAAQHCQADPSGEGGALLN